MKRWNDQEIARIAQEKIIADIRSQAEATAKAEADRAAAARKAEIDSAVAEALAKTR
jgi:hypothetical protein